MVFAWCVGLIHPDKREEWLYQLEAPLPWEDAKKAAPSETDLQKESDMFMDLMQSVKG